jgi:hypothetical protein
MNKIEDAPLQILDLNLKKFGALNGKHHYNYWVLLFMRDFLKRIYVYCKDMTISVFLKFFKEYTNKVFDPNEACELCNSHFILHSF